MGEDGATFFYSAAVFYLILGPPNLLTAVLVSTVVSKIFKRGTGDNTPFHFLDYSSGHVSPTATRVFNNYIYEIYLSFFLVVGKHYQNHLRIKNFCGKEKQQRSFSQAILICV